MPWIFHQLGYLLYALRIAQQVGPLHIMFL